MCFEVGQGFLGDWFGMPCHLRMLLEKMVEQAIMMSLMLIRWVGVLVASLQSAMSARSLQWR
jgi:hypothetical protein